MATRQVFSMLLAVPVTAGLLLLMQMLISAGRAPVVTETFTEIIMPKVQEDSRIETEDYEIIRPREVTPRPEMPQLVDEISPVNIQPVPLGPINETPVLTLGSGISNADELPLVRVAPVYPEPAVRRGLEGYVLLEFSVTNTGATENIRVISSSHSVFNRNAVRAIQKFKYKPRVVNGVPVPVTGVQFRMTFELED